MVSLPLLALKLFGSPEQTNIKARGYATRAFLLLVVLGLFVMARIIGGEGAGHVSPRRPAPGSSGRRRVTCSASLTSATDGRQCRCVATRGEQHDSRRADARARSVLSCSWPLPCRHLAVPGIGRQLRAGVGRGIHVVGERAEPVDPRRAAVRHAHQLRGHGLVRRPPPVPQRHRRLRGIRHPVPVASRRRFGAREPDARQLRVHADHGRRHGVHVQPRRSTASGSRTCGCRARTSPRSSRGSITNWNDPAIARDNPGLQAPERRQIVPVVRSDGAAATYNITEWMIKEYGADSGPRTATSRDARRRAVPRRCTRRSPA